MQDAHPPSLPETGGVQRTSIAWGAATLATLPLIGYGMTFARPERLLDLEVYRRGGQAVVAGAPLYAFTTDHGLPFTYPPFAAVLAVPLGALSQQAAGLLWLSLCLAALGWSVHRLARHRWAAPARRAGAVHRRRVERAGPRRLPLRPGRGPCCSPSPSPT